MNILASRSSNLTQDDIFRYCHGLIKYAQTYNKDIRAASPLELLGCPSYDLQVNVLVFWKTTTRKLLLNQLEVTLWFYLLLTLLSNYSIFNLGSYFTTKEI
jgi:hypothetical protein